MNPEHLELYRKLSATKIYKERFGEWAVGDYVFDSDHGFGFGYLGFGYLGAIGKCTFGVNFTNGQHSGRRRTRLTYSSYSADTLGKVGSMLLWLPPVFDPERPERCLWGMVMKAIIHNNINYFLTMGATAFSDIMVVCYSSLSGDVIKEYEGPLDIALIKTILAQEASHD